MAVMSVERAAAATLAAVSQELPCADLDAFLAAVEKRAYRIAVIATRDRDEALDIVQDAMLQLSSRYASRPAEEWAPLFYRILGNKVRDWQRHQGVRRRLLFWREPQGEDQTDPVELLPDRAAHGEDLLQRTQAMAKLESALRELPARQRQAFELRLWHGLSVAQTAKAMGCSAGSVKTHLFRALHTLREKLQGVWP
jgi:RNA polymerase sigma-70 factor (ECF subfamily)